jgi:hypothetical protein
MDQARIDALLASLKKGETLIVSVKGTSSETKVQMEVAGYVNDSVSLVQMLNKSDARFGGKPRRGWITVEATDLAAALPQVAEQIQAALASESQDAVLVGIKNAKIGGSPLCLRLVEGTASKPSSGVPSSWDLENLETSAKRAGQDGPIITHNGEPVVSRCQVVNVQQFEQLGGHRLLTSDSQVSSGSSVSAVSESDYAAAASEMNG